MVAVGWDLPSSRRAGLETRLTFSTKHIVVTIEELHPYIPTDERPDLNVSLKYIDSYGLPAEQRTQEVAAYPVSKLVSSDQLY